MASLFCLGQIVITMNAKEQLNRQDVLASLARHSQGDWGNLDEADRQENERSLNQGYRILSAYQDRHGTKLWIITEADRSSTTILLPEDY